MSNNNQEFEELQNVQMKKIQYFCSKIGDNNMERAERYLGMAYWDEKKAVDIFIRTHPNHIPFHQNNNQDFYNQQNFQPQIAPPSQVSNNRQNIRIQENKKDKILNENYIEMHIGKTLINENKEFKSACINFLKRNLKSVDNDYNTFIKNLKNRPGVIIILREDINNIKEHIKKINENNKDIDKNYIIYPSINNSPIGKELVKQLSIISFPCYIFCKYKDDVNFYITDRMEGAFDIKFYMESILKNIPESKNINSKNSKSNINKNIPKDRDKKKEEPNNLIKQLKKDNHFNLKNEQRSAQASKRNINNNNNINKDKINKNQNINNNQSKKEDKKNIVPQQNKNNNNNNNWDASEHMGDFYLGNSIEIPNLFGYNNNQIDNNNNFSNPPKNNHPNHLNNYQNINPNIEPNNNININNNNNSSNKNENNILADSIYQLSDAQVLQKRKEQFEKLEKEQEEREKEQEEREKKDKEEKEKQLKYEEEAKLAKKLLPDEPKESDENVCHIIFRAPDGEKAFERRFLKTDKIDILFKYIKSIGREIFTESNSNGFNIISLGFPRINLENKKNNTLEEEGLFPNSVLQIQEKDN